METLWATTTTQQNEVRRYTPNDWDEQRLEIGRLYQDHALEEVRSFMRTHHGLEASAKQYKDRISKWGLYKNVRIDEMEAILRKRGERSAMNKQSAFRVRKQLVSPQKITRYIKEHPELLGVANDGMDMEGAIPSAATPAGISVYTPSNTGPLTPRAAPSPSGMSTHQFATSPRQRSPSHSSPAFNMNMTSPPSILSNPDLFSAPPTPLVEHPDVLMVDSTSVYPDAVPPSPALSISSIVQASTSGFTWQSPALTPSHLHIPSSHQGSEYSPALFEAHSSPSRPAWQTQLGSQPSVPANSEYLGVEEADLRSELSAVELVFGAEHQESLAILLKLSEVHLEQGRYRSAEEITQRLLRAYPIGVEDNEISRLEALEVLSEALKAQGLFLKAEKISRYTVKSRQRIQGDSHVDTIWSMVLLAIIYLDLEKWNAAEELLVKAIQYNGRVF